MKIKFIGFILADSRAQNITRHQVRSKLHRPRLKLAHRARSTEYGKIKVYLPFLHSTALLLSRQQRDCQQEQQYLWSTGVHSCPTIMKQSDFFSSCIFSEKAAKESEIGTRASFHAYHISFPYSFIYQIIYFFSSAYSFPPQQGSRSRLFLSTIHSINQVFTNDLLSGLCSMHFYHRTKFTGKFGLLLFVTIRYLIHSPADDIYYQSSSSTSLLWLFHVSSPGKISELLHARSPILFDNKVCRDNLTCKQWLRLYSALNYWNGPLPPTVAHSKQHIIPRHLIRWSATYRRTLGRKQRKEILQSAHQQVLPIGTNYGTTFYG